MTFIDMFMGSGAVSFAMVDRGVYVIANDKDADVFNLFMTVKEHKEELIKAIQTMPIHDNLFQYWRKQQEHDCVWKATRFLMLSNFGFLGKANSLRFCVGENVQFHHKECIINGIQQVFSRFKDNFWLMSEDFRSIFSKISFKIDEFGRKCYPENTVFIYADPPYLATANNYADDFTEQDSQDLFELLTNSKFRFAISEFDNPFVLNLAKKYELKVTELGERRNLNNRRMEILITNYDPTPRQASLFHGQL